MKVKDVFIKGDTIPNLGKIDNIFNQKGGRGGKFLQYEISGQFYHEDVVKNAYMDDIVGKMSFKKMQEIVSDIHAGKKDLIPLAKRIHDFLKNSRNRDKLRKGVDNKMVSKFNHFESNLLNAISEDVDLPERLPTFEEFVNGVNEEIEIDNTNIKDIINGIYKILKGSDSFTKAEIIDGLKNEFEIVATDQQIDTIIKGIIGKGLNISEADQIKGGRADGMKPEDFDPFELELGITVEREHTDSDELAQEITMDHLVENPAYYTEGFEKKNFDEDISTVLDKWKDDPRAQKLMGLEENGADYMVIKSYPFWDGIIKNVPKPKDRKLLTSIIDFAKKNGDKITPKQWDILQRGKDGRLKPEDYHSKN